MYIETWDVQCDGGVQMEVQMGVPEREISEAKKKRERGFSVGAGMSCRVVSAAAWERLLLLTLGSYPLLTSWCTPGGSIG